MSTDMSSFNNANRIEFITWVRRRRRWTTAQRLELVKQTFEPCIEANIVFYISSLSIRSSVSQVVRHCLLILRIGRRGFNGFGNDPTN